MLFSRSFEIDGAMNFLSRQVKLLSQSSDQIKNFGAKNEQSWQKSALLMQHSFYLEKRGESDTREGLAFFTNKKCLST